MCTHPYTQRLTSSVSLLSFPPRTVDNFVPHRPRIYGRLLDDIRDAANKLEFDVREKAPMDPVPKIERINEYVDLEFLSNGFDVEEGGVGN